MNEELNKVTYLKINKYISNLIGIESACLLSFLIDLNKNIEKEKYYTKDGITYIQTTKENIERATTIKEGKQLFTLKLLRNLNLVLFEIDSFSGNIYFNVSFESLDKLFND